MNYRKGIALGLTIGMIASGILIASLALVSRADADPIWVSQYGGEEGYDYCGQTTASGETFDCGALTAASSYLPFDTLVRVGYAGNSVVVRVNDRCGCPLDLSMAAADAIGLPGADIADVEIL